MKGVHKIYDYHDKVVTVYTSEHTCILCNEKVIRNRDLIRRHARAAHKMSFADYEAKFKAFSAADSATDTSSHKIASPKKKAAQKKPNPQKASNTLRPVGPATPLTNTNDHRSVEWSNGCTYACNFCDKEFGAPKGVKQHLKNVHKSANPMDNYVTVKETHYDCKVCGEEVVRNREALDNHVKSRHGMSMPQYEKRYESGRSHESDGTNNATDLGEGAVDTYNTRGPRDDDANRSPDFNGFGDNAPVEGQNVEASEFSGVMNVTEPTTTDDSGFGGNTDGNADVSSEEGAAAAAEKDPLVPLVKEEQMQMLAITSVVGSGEAEMLGQDTQMLGTPDSEIII